MRNAYSLKGSLVRRPRHRWEDNIKMDLTQIKYDNMRWINLIREGSYDGLL
jgi:hypothetical protein